MDKDPNFLHSRKPLPVFMVLLSRTLQPKLINAVFLQSSSSNHNSKDR